ncbi:MAG: hypothetical protein V4577_02685 [Bacteroidota bacterium]
MKVFLFIICVLAAAGCQKGDIGPASVGLVGTWELRHYSGTIAGVDKDIPKGNGTLLKFSADSTFQHFTNFKADNNGRFKIVKDGITWADEKHDAIYLGDSGDPNFLIVKADSLIIGNTYADGATSVYLRTK